MPIAKGPAAWEAQKRRDEEHNRKRKQREKDERRSHKSVEKRTWTNQGLNHYNLAWRKKNAE